MTPEELADLAHFSRKFRAAYGETSYSHLITLVTQGSLQAAIFRADDLDATFREGTRLRCRGAAGAGVATVGPRDCAFREPSGNLVRIAQG